jgi:hypothetical protein
MTIYPKGQGDVGIAREWTEADLAHDPFAFGMRLMKLADAFEEHGRAILAKARSEPTDLWFFVSGILQCDEAVDLGWHLSDEDLDRLVQRIVAALRAGTPDEGKLGY